MEASRRKCDLFWNVYRRAAEMSEGCTAPFERHIHNDSTPSVPIISHSRGTLHAVDGGRKRYAGDRNVSLWCLLLLTGKVESRIDCHFTVLSALCSAGLLLRMQGLWHDVLWSLLCGRTAWDLSLFVTPHLGWEFFFFYIYYFGRLLSIMINGTVGVEGTYIRIWLWSDNRDKVSLLKCFNVFVFTVLRDF